jgi:hypothetical protein
LEAREVANDAGCLKPRPERSQRRDHPLVTNDCGALFLVAKPVLEGDGNGMRIGKQMSYIQRSLFRCEGLAQEDDDIGGLHAPRIGPSLEPGLAVHRHARQWSMRPAP